MWCPQLSKKDREFLIYVIQNIEKENRRPVLESILLEIERRLENSQENTLRLSLIQSLEYKLKEITHKK